MSQQKVLVIALFSKFDIQCLDLLKLIDEFLEREIFVVVSLHGHHTYAVIAPGVNLDPVEKLAYFWFHQICLIEIGTQVRNWHNEVLGCVS